MEEQGLALKLCQTFTQAAHAYTKRIGLRIRKTSRKFLRKPNSILYLRLIFYAVVHKPMTCHASPMMKAKTPLVDL